MAERNDVIPEKEHQWLAEQKNENRVVKPLTRKIPSWADRIEGKVFVFTKSMKTGNERENIKNRQLIAQFNRIGDHRAYTLFLYDKKMDKNVIEEIERANDMHNELVTKAKAKKSEVEAVGGTPPRFPRHFSALPEKK